MTDNSSADPAILAEVKRVEESVSHSAQTQFSSAKFWRATHLLLGILAAASAAMAGTAALADVFDVKTAACFALIAAALTAVMTSLNAAQRAEQSRMSANDFLTLQGKARVLRTVDLDRLSYEDARLRLSELCESRDVSNEKAPVAAFLAYWFGRRNIEKGRQTYEIDKA